MSYYGKNIKILGEALYKKDYLTRQIIHAKQFIDKNFGERINLENMAREAYLSKFHFVRLFKANYGRTPYQYLVEVRMKKAKELLKRELPVSTVCVSVGFDSVPSFTRLFKKITGTTPARFQLLAKKATLDKTC